MYEQFQTSGLKQTTWKPSIPVKCLRAPCGASMNISLKKQQHLDLMKTLGLNGSTVSERTVNYCFKAAPYSGFLSFFFKKKEKNSEMLGVI